MRELVVPLVVASILAACSGPAVVSRPDSETPTDTETETDLPAGTVAPSPTTSITRYVGDAQNVAYDRDSDSIFVDNLPFDGANSPYTREATNPVRSLGGISGVNTGPFRVYESPATIPDAATGDPIEQARYRAVRGESTATVNGKPRTSFTIVRTGSYTGYGFGGFVYERNGGVTIPTPNTNSPVDEAQGIYTGDYAGMVDFDEGGGLTYVSGKATVTIDFQDFNDQPEIGDAVYAEIIGRRYYSLDGDDITPAYLNTLNADLGYDPGEGLTQVPILQIPITQGGVLTENGKMRSTIYAQAQREGGTIETYQSGQFYAVLAGDANTANSEIVGIVVVEGQLGGVPARETGGFIVYRGAGH